MGSRRWTIDVDAPPERVFAFLCDPELISRRMPGAFTYEVISEHEGVVGSCSRTRTETNGYVRVVEQEVVRYEPNRLLETRCRCRITNQGRTLPGFSFRQRFELEGNGDRCRVVWSYRPAGLSRWWVALMEFFYGIESGPAQAELERLKNVIETEP